MLFLKNDMETNNGSAIGLYKPAKYAFKINVIVCIVLWIICNFITACFSQGYPFGEQAYILYIISFLFYSIIGIIGLVYIVSQSKKIKRGWIYFSLGAFIWLVILPQWFSNILNLLFFGNHLLGVYQYSFYLIVSEVVYIIWLITWPTIRLSHKTSLNENNGLKPSVRDWQALIGIILIYTISLFCSFWFRRIQNGELTNFCSIILYQEEKDYCYNTLAKEKQDLVICDKIQGPISKNRCYENIADITKDISICDNLIGTNRLSEQDSKDSCYNGLAFIKQDISICDKISVKSTRERCYTYTINK